MDKKERRQQYWFVIRELTSREIKRKYARSKLGIVWSVLNPLLSMVVISLIFSTMFRRSIEYFPVYYLCGSVMWSLFTSSTNTAMTSIVDNKMMLIKVKFPMQIFVMSRIWTAFVNFLYSLIAFGIVYAFFIIATDLTISAYLLFFPFVVFWEMLFCIGLSDILATAYVFFGDVKHLYGVILTLWMYLSALFYPVTSLPAIMQRIISCNPMYAYISGLRSLVLDHSLPSLPEIAKMVCFGLVMYMIGQYCFNKSRHQIMVKL
ncbi:MAG: ABC transporter permease [Lachnospiraceae bacterium]|nr:ABC transporter permease [Lachnospiraceae bacterium]